MKAAPKLFALGAFAALSAPVLAEIPLGDVGGSSITFEGMVQADLVGHVVVKELVNVEAIGAFGCRRHAKEKRGLQVVNHS